MRVFFITRVTHHEGPFPIWFDMGFVKGGFRDAHHLVLALQAEIELTRKCMVRGGGVICPRHLPAAPL